MPSASAKLEKQASVEACDPMNQVLNMVEKKVRNLEKRKGKLDGYKEDFNSGKELNEDQKNAVTKYEQVVEVLEFSKDMHKAVKVIYQDWLKTQKKAAKREQVEKQQQEIARTKDLFLLQDLLNNMGTDETRQDFLEQTNGAVKLSEEELTHLDELYKLISPEREHNVVSEGPPFLEQLATAAEHMVMLLEGRTKEILGTNYKTLKETLMKIHASGYFDNVASTAEEEVATEEELPVQEVAPNVAEVEELADKGFQQPSEDFGAPLAADLTHASRASIQVEGVFYPSGSNYVAPGAQPQQPLTEVLHGQAPINFLQDSQVDLESPHMDPAVVVAHPMAPPPMGYPPMPYGATVASTIMPSPPEASTNSFDPIPTQTFTNQNFAANLPSMVVPPTSPYIAATLPGSPLNLSGILPPQPLRVSPDLGVQKPDSFVKVAAAANDFQANNNLAQPHYHSSDENEVEGENNDGFEVKGSRDNSRQQQGGYGGRGGRGGPRGGGFRGGPVNGYGSGRGGRGNYNNGGSSRGSYQGGSNNYGGNRDFNSGNREFNNGQPRRGGGGPNPRGAAGPRGGGAPRGGPTQGGPARGGRGRPAAQQQQQ